MEMNRKRPAIISCLCFMLWSGIGLAEEGHPQSVKEELPAMIRIGQSLRDAKEVLGERDIDWHNAHMQWMILEDEGDEVADPIAFSLGNEDVSFLLFYSAAKQRIESILVRITPPDEGKDSVELEARSVNLNSDESYVVHFSPPAKDRGQPDLPEAKAALPKRRPPSKPSR